MHEESIKAYRVLVKKPEEIITLGNLDVDEKLSNWTLKKCDGRAWIGLM